MLSPFAALTLSVDTTKHMLFTDVSRGWAAHQADTAARSSLGSSGALRRPQSLEGLEAGKGVRSDPGEMGQIRVK